MRFLRCIFSYCRAFFTATPLISRTYNWRSCSGIHCAMELSTWYPHYRAVFSEPLSSWLLDEWRMWRYECVRAFEKETGTKIPRASLESFVNERVTFYP